MWEDIVFDIEYWWDRNVIQRWLTFKVGIKNFWKYKKIIWNDRWWDHAFLHDIIKFKLDDMRNHWHIDTHYCNDWNERLLLERLVEILDEIEYIENEMPEVMTWKEQEEKIDELYQEFGHLLFDVREFEIYDCTGHEKTTIKTSAIRKLWD